MDSLRAPSGRAHFKGAVLKELGPWLQRVFGSDAVRRAFDAVPEDLRRGLDVSAAGFGALPSGWYDARLYQTLFDSLIEHQSGRDRTALAEDAARVVLGETLQGIYKRLFALMATPPLYARYAQKMWDTHYDTGEVTIEHEAPMVARHTVSRWAGHHPFACAVNRASGRVIYEMMGQKNVRILRERCSPPVCEALYSWTG